MLRLRAVRVWCALVAVLAAPTVFASPFVLQRTYLGQTSLDQFGFAVQSAGDVNGDRFADFLIGANVNDGGAPGGGRVYIYWGGPEYPSTPALRYTGTHESENVGGAVAGGADLDGDGFDDWAAGAPGMGAPGNDPGRVYVFLGGAVPDSVPALVLEGTTSGGQFGASVLLVRDLDGDGYGDLVVGAPRAGNGAVSIFRGGPRPLDVV